MSGEEGASGKGFSRMPPRNAIDVQEVALEPLPASLLWRPHPQRGSPSHPLGRIDSSHGLRRGRRADMDRSRCPEVNATAQQAPQHVEDLIEAYGPLVKYL